MANQSPYRFVGFTDLELADELDRQADWIYTREPVTTKSREIAELMRTAASRLRPKWEPFANGAPRPNHPIPAEPVEPPPPRPDEQPWVGKSRSRKRR